MPSKYAFCPGCPLETSPVCKIINFNPVPVLVVDEYPTSLETNTGCVWRAPQSNAFKAQLKNVGFKIEDCHFTYAIRCLPPPGSTDWDHLTAIDTCSQNILLREILHCKPKLIIGLGNYALKAVAGESTGIVSRAGTLQELTFKRGDEEHTCLFIPLLTLKYLNVVPQKAASQVRNMEFAFETYQISKVGTQKNDYRVLTDLDSALAALDSLYPVPTFTFDLETTGLDEHAGKILGIGFSSGPHSGFYIPINHRESLNTPKVCEVCNGIGKIEVTPGEDDENTKPKKSRCAACKGKGETYLSSGLTPYWNPDSHNQIIQKMLWLFRDSEAVKVAHNIGFETKWMLKHFGFNLEELYALSPYKFFDTQMYAYFRDPYTSDGSRSISLGALSSKYPDLVSLKSIWDDVPAKGPHDLSLYHPTEKIGSYCCGDCDATYRLWSEYAPELEQWRPEGFDQKRFFHERIMANLFFVSEMHRNGIPVSKDNMVKAKDRVISTCQEIVEKIKATDFRPFDSPEGRPTIYRVPTDFNPNSVVHLRNFVFNKLKLPGVVGTKKEPRKKTSTGSEALEIWVNQYGSEFARLMLDYRMVDIHRKNLISQVERLLNPATGCVHPDIKVWGTETGRLAVSNPPLHGMPSSGPWAKAVRSMFRAPDGWLILGADFSQIELRLIGWASGCQALLEAYEKNLDMHSYTSSLLFDIPIELMDKKTHPENQWMRQIGKTANFAWCYCGSPNVVVPLLGNSLIPDTVIVDQFKADPKDKKKIRIPVEMLQAYAQKYHKKYFEVFPELVKWKNREVTKARQREYAISPYGRVRRLREINSPDDRIRAHAENQAVNHPIQSAASDYLLFRFQDIVKVCRERNLQVKPLLSIHDALYLLIREGDREDIETIVRTVGAMKDEANFTVPMVLEPKCGNGFDDFVE